MNAIVTGNGEPTLSGMNFLAPGEVRLYHNQGHLPEGEKVRISRDYREFGLFIFSGNLSFL